MALTEEQKQQRRKGIGGSDAGAILGINQYKSAFTLFQEKTGAISDEVEYNDYMYWGDKLETLVGNRFCEETQTEEIKFSQLNLALPEVPEYILGIPDLFVIEKTASDYPSVVEIKTTSYKDPDEFMENLINHSYYAQLQHYLLKTGLSKGYIAVLFMDRREFRYNEYPRNEDFINTLTEAYMSFWRRVELNEWPDIVDGSESTLEALKELHPDDNGNTTELSHEVMSAWNNRKKMKEIISDCEANEKLSNNIIRNAMGDNTFGIMPDGTKLSFKKTTRNNKAKEASISSFRSLREVKNK